MSEQTLHIKPAPGRVIVYPQTRERLPTKGAVVPASSYWLRRRHDGDVVDVKPEAAVVELTGTEAQAKVKAPNNKTRNSGGEQAAERNDA